jgi:hypothetical protein
MEETVGTLNLKIARLQQRLGILLQQQNLGRAYPEFQVSLNQQKAELESQLRSLIQRREEMGRDAIEYLQKGDINGEHSGCEPLFPIS